MPAFRQKKLQTAVCDYIDIEGYVQGTVAYTDTAADDDDLPEGLYDVWSDQDCYIKVHATDASDVTTATGYILYANHVITVVVRPASHLGAIRSTTNGTLYYHKVG